MRKYLIILFIAFISVLNCQLNQLRIEGKAELQSGIILSKGIQDKNMEQAALIVFLTDLDVDMVFRPANGLVRAVDSKNPGRFEVYVSPRERYITVNATGFKEFEVVLSSYGIRRLQSGDVYQLELTGDVKVTNIPVLISCNQNGAEVFVDEVTQGKISNKMLTMNIGTGLRRIKVVKDGFGTQEIEEKISEENNSFNFKLFPALPATVEIITEPEGATVYIDNVKFGKTPKSSFFNAGTYPIRIEKENYEPINEEITIIEPETKKSYTLTDIRATLTVKTHPNATVTINGRDFIGGISELKTAPQVLKVEVTMPKAESISRVVTLQPKSVETIEIYPESQTGTIQVVVIPNTANVEIIGDSGEHYTSLGRDTFIDVPTGDYILTTTSDGYKTYTAMFSLSSDETVLEQISMEEGSDISDYISKKGISMVAVEGGTYQMGYNDGHKDERPIHSVNVGDFYIGKYEVTRGQWTKIMGVYLQSPNLPLEEVSWYDAVKFCNRLSELEGFEKCYSGSEKSIKCNYSANGYRLPTEAEWEFAARGGNQSNGYTYSGSNNIEEVSWYKSNSGSKTHSVGSKKPNELGIYDMTGNVWEWCSDWYGDYSSNSQSNPTGSTAGSRRVFRGGGWYYSASRCRVAYRSYSRTDYSNYTIGFRLSRNAK